MSNSSEHVQRTIQELEKAKRLGTFVQANHPILHGLSPPSESTTQRDGMLIHTDVIIPTRDGTKLRGNIFRPATQSSEKLPVILNYSVYGKDGALEPCIFPKGSRLDNGRYTSYYIFEACDAPWWTERGYIVAYVDARGSFQSEGDKSYYSRDVGLDGYNIVEWLAAQEWANRKVGMYGASAFAMIQWLVAAERPPSLAVRQDSLTSASLETHSDLGNSTLRWYDGFIPGDGSQGGIPETQFMSQYPYQFNSGRGLVEDASKAHYEHPYFDEYWESKIPRVEEIQCPAYIVCGWGDHAIHTRGTLNEWRRIGSANKYLEIHCYQKWEYALTEESLMRQKAFFDTYLLEKETEVKFWPPVRWTMRESFYNAEWRYAPTFPFPGTAYEKLYPTPSGGLSYIPQLTESRVSYDAQAGEVTFEIPFSESYEFAGHAKLRLWVEAEGADNMDIFIVLKKLDENGNEVHFPWLTIIEDGPVAFGYLRASRREVDEIKSTDFQPYHSHQRDLLLEPKQIVPVDIEILPTACRFRPGETLQVHISGHDYGNYPTAVTIARHSDTANKGTHIIHFGGKYDSFLQLPGIPPLPGTTMSRSRPVKMTLISNRITGWSNEKFLEEFTQVHGGMTEKLSHVVPFLRSYTQVVGVPRLPLTTFSTNHAAFEVAAVLAWSSLSQAGGFLQASGLQSDQEVQEIIYDPVTYKRRQDAIEVVVFLARNSGVEAVSDADLEARSNTVRNVGQGTGLLRYVLNRDVTPQDYNLLFKDTPFIIGSWGSIGAMEQYWFTDKKAAMEFFADSARNKVLQQLPSSFDPKNTWSVSGKENRVFSKDLHF
ncbi:Peptidase S15/CocE/NonD C-terminal [Penicillium expansum]|nr:Peptidase S15/CocE/NonD C-terminal [Penicillium expansum]